METTNEKIDLIVKYLTGEASADEAQQLLDWANENNANKKLYVELKDIWDLAQASGSNKFDSQLAWEQFRKQIQERLNQNDEAPTKLIWMSFLKIAAAVVITFGISWGAFMYQYKSDQRITSNEIQVPNGSKTLILLADGSKVWLNSGSKLSYLSDYNGSSRVVKLTGEAFFDVVKNPKKPFIVKTGSIDVKAYGTKFNVKSYANDDFVEALLVSGIVTLEREGNNKPIATLKPAQKTICYKENAQLSFESRLENQNNMEEIEKIVAVNALEKIVLTETKPENFTEWKDQKLIFNSETFEEIALKLERWYGVKIHLQTDKLKKERFTGKFIHNEPIKQVLEAIKVITQIDYSIKLNDVYISIKS